MSLWNPKAVWRHSALCVLLTAVALLVIAFFVPASAPPPLANADASANSATEHAIPGSTTVIDGAGNYSHVRPGDRLLIRAGTRGPLKIRNLKGQPGARITIVNHGGPVRIQGGTVGITIENSQHIYLTGTGDAAVPYGFDVSGFTNSGVTVRKQTEYIEIDNFEVHHSGSHAAGFRIGSLLADVPSGWVQHDTYIHDCYIHDVTTEAFYAGHGADQKNPGAPLHNLEIARCRIERCGWDGIQVRNVPQGAQIHDNHIQDVGMQVGGTSQGGAGLIIGRDAGGQWYNNVIVNADRGIQLLHHQANVEIYNNLLVHCGYVRDQGGIIWFTSNPAIIHHNTIVDSNSFGIRANNSTTKGEIRDNIIAKSKGTHIDANVPKVHNLKVDNVEQAKFVDPASRNYHLQSDSPARGAGSNGTDVGAFPYRELFRVFYPLVEHEGPWPGR